MIEMESMELMEQDDEIPNAGFQPRPQRRTWSVQGQSGWKEFRRNQQVNGNLALTSRTWDFKHSDVKQERTTTALIPRLTDLGYGWNFNYGEKLQVGND